MRNTVLLLFLIPIFLTQRESTQSPFACDSSNSATNSHPFCKLTLPISDRARYLVSRLTLDEKVGQLVNSAAYEWWSEALHGLANVGDGQVPQGIRFNGLIRSATSFPQVILSAASFDSKLWYRIGQIRKFGGGKLPITWYSNEFGKVPMTDMRMRPDPSLGYPGLTYRFYTGEKVFEFGYGLRYSKYSYEFVSITQNKFNLNHRLLRPLRTQIRFITCRFRT